MKTRSASMFWGLVALGLIFSLTVPTTSSWGQLVNYDQFTGPDIDANKWTDWEFVREIRSINGNNALFSKTTSYGKNISNLLLLKNPGPVCYLEADVTLQMIQGNFDLSETDISSRIHAGLAGNFYNDGTGSPGSYIGEVQAQVRIGLIKGNLKASWAVIKFTDAAGSKFNLLGSGLFSLPAVGLIPQKLSLQWDPGSRKFIFSFNG
jgi:hypothetical protein